MNSKSKLILDDLETVTKQDKDRGVGMWQFRMRHSKIKQREWHQIIKDLVNSHKIEIFGEDQRIRVI